MKRYVFLFALLLLLTPPLLAQSPAERGVLERVRSMMEAQGQITFSDLYNSPDLTAAQREFLARLYEIFFQIPAFLKSEFESTGRVPTRAHLAASFGVSRASVELLLAVMQSDPRVPPMLERGKDGEITSLNMANIEAFIRERGSGVRITRWEGQPAPAFSLKTLDGRPFSSRDLAGKSTLLYFWFTGCPPCARIAPILTELHERYSASGFQVVGVNMDRVLGLDVTDHDRSNYLEFHRMPFTNLHADAAVRRAFGNVSVFPTLFFVGSDGVIRAHMINFQDRTLLESVIRGMLGADP